MSELPEPTLGVPDSYALRRRVLLTGLVSVVLFIGIAAFVAWLQVADAWLLVGLALAYLVVVRPMMAPVRDAIKLRRRLAYHAYLAERHHKDDA